MQGTLEIFIASLTNYELCVFYTHRLNEFLPASREKILKELSKRNIPLSDIPFLIEREKRSYTESQKKKFPGGNLCARCASDRNYTEERRTFGTRYRGERIVVRSICEVCGYDPLIRSIENENIDHVLSRLFRRLTGRRD